MTLGARLSPSRAAMWGLILAAPAALFLAANILNEFGIGFLYAPIDPLISDPARQRVFNIASPIVLLGGIGGALVVNLLAIARCDLQLDTRRLVGTVTVEPRAANVALILTVGVMLAFLMGYAFVENYRIVPTHV